uniref:Putative ovule protein n=1 Tax=Solanum chacoense TaxID=4108 RepID=A0A0V0GI74_SOLCH
MRVCLGAIKISLLILVTTMRFFLGTIKIILLVLVTTMSGEKRGVQMHQVMLFLVSGLHVHIVI